MAKSKKCSWCGKVVHMSQAQWIVAPAIGYVCSKKCKAEKAGGGSASHNSSGVGGDDDVSEAAAKVAGYGMLGYVGVGLVTWLVSDSVFAGIFWPIYLLWHWAFG